MTENKLTVSVAEASKMLGISKPTMYSLVKSAGFPCFHIGGRTLIPINALEEWVKEKTRVSING